MGVSPTATASSGDEALKGGDAVASGVRTGSLSVRPFSDLDVEADIGWFDISAISETVCEGNRFKSWRNETERRAFAPYMQGSFPETLKDRRGS